MPSFGDEQQPVFEESGPLLPLTAQHYDRNGADDGVVVVDKDDVVRYVEYVPEITNEPDYEKALAFVRELAK